MVPALFRVTDWLGQFVDAAIQILPAAIQQPVTEQIGLLLAVIQVVHSRLIDCGARQIALAMTIRALSVAVVRARMRRQMRHD